MTEKLTLATALDVVSVVYGWMADEATRPGTKAGIVARMEAYGRELEGLLVRGGRNPSDYWRRGGPTPNEEE